MLPLAVGYGSSAGPPRWRAHQAQRDQDESVHHDRHPQRPPSATRPWSYRHRHCNLRATGERAQQGARCSGEHAHRLSDAVPSADLSIRNSSAQRRQRRRRPRESVRFAFPSAGAEALGRSRLAALGVLRGLVGRGRGGEAYHGGEAAAGRGVAVKVDPADRLERCRRRRDRRDALCTTTHMGHRLLQWCWKQNYLVEM